MHKKLFTSTALAFGLVSSLLIPSRAHAAPAQDRVNVVPTVTNIVVRDGGLVALGNVTTTFRGRTVTLPFVAPITLGLDPDDPGTGTCPVLDLALGPINLDLLGLVVETSPICLNITAIEGGGLLGDLLCDLGGLLDGGLSLSNILSGAGVGPLPGLTPADRLALQGLLTDLLNQALANILNAAIADILDGSNGNCDILHLELGPLDLTLLGLNVVLDDCEGGPVVVDISAERGRNNLLGNLLCSLTNAGRIGLGSTLRDLLGLLARQP